MVKAQKKTSVAEKEWGWRKLQEMELGQRS